jgi:hypothetical protein
MEVRMPACGASYVPRPVDAEFAGAFVDSVAPADVRLGAGVPGRSVGGRIGASSAGATRPTHQRGADCRADSVSGRKTGLKNVTRDTASESRSREISLSLSGVTIQTGNQRCDDSMLRASFSGGLMRSSVAVPRLLAIAASALLATACVAEEPGSSIEIPLVQNASDGALYRLSNASFEVVGPDGTAQVVDGNVDAPSVTLELNPGRYTVRLVPGWTLERSLDGTTFEPLEAILGNQNPQTVRVFPDNAQQVVFRFYVRDAQGMLTIGFGVVPDPQQLLGTLSFTQATGLLANYAGKSVSYSIYFDPTQQSTDVAPDGTKRRHYAATQIAVEFFDDPVGLFTGPLGALGPGGSLDMSVRAASDGSQTVEGTVVNAAGNPLTFGPAAVSVGLDSNGFPNDAAFSVVAPFSLTGSQSTASGTTTVNHFLD